MNTEERRVSGWLRSKKLLALRLEEALKERDSALERARAALALNAEMARTVEKQMRLSAEIVAKVEQLTNHLRPHATNLEETP